ncbi:MAG: DUF4168 domain-containing protein [Alistipes putredinis]|nr:MAG: DUF4168 domain-containing protein [Alistipes putredinis]
MAEQRLDENKKWNLKDAILSLGSEIFSDQYRKASAEDTSAKHSWTDVEALMEKAEQVRSSMRRNASRAVGIIESNGLSVSDFNYGKSGFANYFYEIARGEIKPYKKTRAGRPDSGCALGLKVGRRTRLDGGGGCEANCRAFSAV